MVVPGRTGGGPEIEPSTRSSRAPASVAARLRAVAGAIAFRSATSGLLPVLAAALGRSPRRRRSPRPVGPPSRTTSAVPTTSSTPGSSSRPLAAASRRVARAARSRGRDDPGAAAREQRAEGTPHRTGADNADRRHVRAGYGARDDRSGAVDAAQRARTRADAPRLVVFLAGDTCARARADLRPLVAVRGRARAGGRARCVLHLPGRRGPDRGRAQPGRASCGRSSTSAAIAGTRLRWDAAGARRCSAPTTPGRTTSTACCVPRRAPSARAASTTRSGASSPFSSAPGARWSSSTPIWMPRLWRRRSVSSRSRWPSAVSIRRRSRIAAGRASGSSRRTGRSSSRTSSSATTAPSRTRASAG